ncbi:MAG: hypothetical protein ACLFPQ_06225 [Candidatus Woesearchaeota archaeon]
MKKLFRIIKENYRENLEFDLDTDNEAIKMLEEYGFERKDNFYHKGGKFVFPKDIIGPDKSPIFEGTLYFYIPPDDKDTFEESLNDLNYKINDKGKLAGKIIGASMGIIGGTTLYSAMGIDNLSILQYVGISALALLGARLSNQIIDLFEANVSYSAFIKLSHSDEKASTQLEGLLSQYSIEMNEPMLLSYLKDDSDDIYDKHVILDAVTDPIEY